MRRGGEGNLSVRQEMTGCGSYKEKEGCREVELAHCMGRGLLVLHLELEVQSCVCVLGGRE